MAATADQIAELRRKVAEPTTTTYSDAAIRAYIERYPLADVNREQPFTDQYMAGSTLTQLANPLWIPTYDLNAAAAEVWGEKASALSNQIDFEADGGVYSASQKYEQAMKQQRHYAARKAASSIRVASSPEFATARERLDPDNTNL